MSKENEYPENSFSIFPNERFVDLSLYQFGRERCTPLHSYGPFVRNHYLFHYVISGTGTLQATDSKGKNQSYKIRSGQGFLISPKQVTTYYADKDNPWEYVWLEFDGLKVKENLMLAGLDEDTPIYRSSNPQTTLKLKDTMLYIAGHPTMSPLHLIGHAYLFFDYLTSSSKNKTILSGGKMRDYYMKESLSFIEQNFQNHITIEDIANFCNINRSYLGKIFRESVGKSPQEFLIAYRMSKAAQLLKMTDMSIKDIGKGVGYENQLHFSRAFKNVYDVSPRYFREENR